MTDAEDTIAFGGLRLPRFGSGEVWLTGAGPGDPGLLTLHALNALRQADIILFDALVPEPVLRLAGAGAVLEFAGKRGGRPSPDQRDITDRLIELARQGKKVLRLKGGDPFVFGRGSEEALGLANAGIAGPSARLVGGVALTSIDGLKLSSAAELGGLGGGFTTWSLRARGGVAF